MDIHKAKPVHSWRDFLDEVVIIVVGVLIAISFEALVERLHWALEVRAARVTLAVEMGRANQAFAFRAAVGPCIARRLDALDGIVEAVARHAPARYLGSVLPDVGNAFYNNVWEAHRASQTLTHFNARELNLLSGYYFQLDSVQRDIISEADAWGYLRVLEGDPSRLGPADIAGLRVALHHARFQNDLITALSALELDYSRSLHLTIPTADARRLGEVCSPLR